MDIERAPTPKTTCADKMERRYNLRENAVPPSQMNHGNCSQTKVCIHLLVASKKKNEIQLPIGWYVSIAARRWNPVFHADMPQLKEKKKRRGWWLRHSRYMEKKRVLLSRVSLFPLHRVRSSTCHRLKRRPQRMLTAKRNSSRSFEIIPSGCPCTAGLRSCGGGCTSRAIATHATCNSGTY